MTDPELEAWARQFETDPGTVELVQRVEGSGWFDRAGRPISLLQADALLASGYPRVAEDTLGALWVSTVWLGLDQTFSRSEPTEIFETVVFGLPGGVWLQRYATEAAAVEGHRQVLRELRDRGGPSYSQSLRKR